MSDTSFGGGLDTGGGASAGTGPGTDALPGQPGASPNQFGSFLSTFTGPKTAPPKPGASALDTAETTLKSQTDFYNNAASNPIWQFFDPEGVAKARAKALQSTEQLQQVQAQKAKQLEIQQMSRNFGIQNIPEGADRETAVNMMADELHKRYLNGDPTAAQGLQQLGRTDLVQGGADQALSAAAANNDRHRTAFGQLSSARNEGEYNAARSMLEKQTKAGVHSEAELSFVPRTYDEFLKKKQQIGNALAVQQLQIESQRARMQQLGGVVPIQKQTDKDGNATGLHAAVASQVRDENGQPLAGLEPVTVGGVHNGNRAPVGSKDINAVGDKWGFMPSSEIAEIQKRVEPHKAGVERAAGINKLDDIAKQKDFGTNAWLLGHGIDQFVEISRNGVGGKGSATPGTISIMENLRGHLQTFGDKVQKEWRQVEDWVTNGKKGPQPYMSPETINGLKDAIKVLKQGSDTEVGGNLGSTAQYVGRHGGKLSDMGLEPGLAGALAPYWQQGNQDLKRDLASRPSVVSGSQRIFFDPEGTRPATATVPGGFGNSPDDVNHPARMAPARNQPPSAGSPPPGSPPSGPSRQGAGPQSPGGGTVTIAGAPVNPPPIDGASDKFLAATQRIESGNEKSPWTAGSSLSSAKGAFQFINDTWAHNKPPGAPNDPRQATPQQQTEAVANLANKNAAALKNSGLPVNDTSLYMAHNVGAGGAAALLHADPGADARTVVGEAAARNNPLFFKGRPTVAKVLERYADEMQKGGVTGGNVEDFARHRANATNQRAAFGRTPTPGGAPVAPPISGPNVQGQEGAGTFTTGRPGETDAVQKGIEAAPAIGGTVGAVAGGPVGGAAGGAAGQAFKNYMNGEKAIQPNLIGAAAFGASGAVGGATLTGAVARTAIGAAGGGVQGGVEGGAAGAVRGAIEGGAGSVLGEAGARAGVKAAGLLDKFGGFLGMGGHQTFSRLTPEAQSAYMDSAKVVAEGKPEPPASLPNGGKNEAATKAYEEKLAAYEDAERHMKTVLPHVKPEEGAYAAQQVGNDRGEAVTGRPIAAEKAAVGKGLDEIRQEVADAGKAKGITSVKGSGPQLPDGPLANLRSPQNPAGKIPATPEVEQAFTQAELLATAPAPNGAGQRWDNLLKARSELLTQERNALAGATPDAVTAKAMRAGADTLRPEIERTAKALFGDNAPAVLKRMDMLHQRYAIVMKLAENGDIAGTIAKGGKEGRDTAAAFKALAHDDPVAQRVMNELVRLGKKNVEKDVRALVGVERIPILGKLFSVAKLTEFANDWLVRRGSGQPIKMDKLLSKEGAPVIDPVTAARTGAAAGARGGQAGDDALQNWILQP